MSDPRIELVARTWYESETPDHSFADLGTSATRNRYMAHAQAVLIALADSFAAERAEGRAEMIAALRDRQRRYYCDCVTHLESLAASPATTGEATDARS